MSRRTLKQIEERLIRDHIRLMRIAPGDEVGRQRAIRTARRQARAVAGIDFRRLRG